MFNSFDIENYIQKLKIAKKTASHAFTSSPTGAIDIGRIIEQKPDYYIKPTADTRTVSKTLIFADWSTYAYTQNQREITKTILQRLLDEKFEIYIWQHYEFKLVKNINELFKYEVTLSNQEEIKRHAVRQLKKTSDEFHIFDFEEMRHIFFPNAPHLQSCVPLETYRAHQIHQLKYYYSQNPPKGILISNLNLKKSSFSNTSNILEHFYRDFPEYRDLPIYTEINSLEFSIEQVTSKNKNVLLTALQQKNLPFTPPLLEKISNVSLSLPEVDIDATEEILENFVNFAASTPHLERLILENIPSTTNIPLKLKKLEVSYNQGDVLTLNVNAAEILNICQDYNTFEPISLDLTIENQDLIYEIELSGVRFNLCSLSNLRELKTLSIFNSELSGQLANSLHQLQNLFLFQNHQQDLDFLQQCPNLKNLQLNSDERISVPELDLPKLEECELSGIDASQIQNVVKKSKMLRCLDISNPLFQAPNETLNIDISCLQKFGLYYQYELLLDCSDCLSAGANLEELRIHIKQFSIRDGLQFPNLKSLSISTKSEGNVEKILREAPSLENLKLSDVTLTDLSNIYLHHLKSLCLNSISADKKTLAKLASFSDQLESLELRNMPTIDIQFLLSQSLTHLKKLSIDVSHMEKEHLKQILLKLNRNKLLKEINLFGLPERFKYDEQLIAILKPFSIVNGLYPFHDKSLPPHSPKPTTHLSNLSTFCNADTTPDPNASFHCTEFILPLDDSAKPLVNHYRLKTFGQLAFGSESTPFILSNHEALQWDESKKPIQTSNLKQHIPQNPQGYFHGQCRLQASSQWQALPSLYPDEILTHFQVSPNQPIQIQYSLRDNLYYVKCDQNIEINFLLHHPQMIRTPLPPGIIDLIEHFKQFTAKTLENPPLDPEERLKAIIVQNVGACRHRAAAFKYLMDKAEVPARIIVNDCHAYVEVKHDNQWHRCELGGYQANLYITEMSEHIYTEQPDNQDTSPKIKKIPPPAIRQTQMEYISEEELEYRQQFKRQQAAEVSSLNEFIFPLINGEKPKQLIHTPVDEIQALSFAIQKLALNTGHPVFYIDSPDDLVCSSRVFKRGSDNAGEWHAKGGLLYDFIQETQHANRPPVFIINYAKFSADDIARISNSLYDKTANADGTPLRKDTLIIGLSDPNLPNSYTGADFYSRFDKINDFPRHLPIANIQVFQNLSDAPEHCFEINLFNSPNWKNKLFGGWKIIDNIPVFVPGVLDHALASKQPIKILTPPKDPEFTKIWTQARLTEHIKTPNDTFHVPKTLDVFIEERQELNLEHITTSDAPAQNAKILNPTLVSHFFNQYQFNNGKLSQAPGYIEAFAGQTLPVYLTRNLSQDTWSELLSLCHQHQVTLDIACAIDIQLPNFLSDRIPLPALSSSGPLNSPIEYPCIYTQDTDFTLHQLPNKNEWVIIDISELKMADLVLAIHGKIEADAFVFTEKKQALTQLLEMGKKVILKGQFSNELKDELIAFIQNRQTDAPGQLLIISNSPIPGIATFYEHTFDRADFLNDVPEEIQRKIPKIEQLSFAQLQTRVEYLKKHPQGSADEPYKGLEKIIPQIKLPPFNPETAEQDTRQFIKARQTLIRQHLEHQPYVFIAGLTGVGKSRFVETECSSEYTIHIGENLENFKKWAQSPGESPQVLFIDEANLSTHQWSEFEGLFQENPGVVIDGEYHPLSKNHKVIFAGNPLNYGDDRQIAPLFARHGNAVIFEPLSPAFIYEKVIKDIFKDTDIDVPRIGNILLDYYQYVTECSQQEVLITPRQVQMIAILVKNFAAQHHQHTEQMAHYYAQQIALPLVPENKRHAFRARFPEVERIETEALSASSSTTDLSTASSQFCQTPSRLPVQHQIKDFLGLQKAGINQGLNRLVLEGEAGVGKTEMMIDALVTEGYQKGNIQRPGNANTFYHIPASMNQKQKKDILLKAFDEGAIVLIDEINSIATMEKLLNSILDNKHPDTLERAKNPGFRLIGTQNPAYYAGRNIDSPALASRTINIQIPPYPTHEMIDILQAKGLPEEQAKPLVSAFEYMRTQAILNRERQIPSFRDLIKKAEHLIKAQEKLDERWEIDAETGYLTDDTQRLSPLFEISTNSSSFDQHEKLKIKYARTSGQYPETTIFALSRPPHDETTEYQLNGHEETIRDQKQLKDFYSPNGLEVYAPSSKQAYALKDDGHRTQAVLYQTGKIDYIKATLTIMNMIENILSRSNDVSISTKDPILAHIADEYIKYLHHVHLSSTYHYAEDVHPLRIKHAENILHLLMLKLPNLDPSSLPWFTEALKHKNETGQQSTMVASQR